MTELEIICEITKIIRIRDSRVSLVDGIARAKRVIESPEELGLLCKETFEFIREIERRNRTGR